MKRYPAALTVATGHDGELDTLYCLASDGTVWTKVVTVNDDQPWRQIESLPDSPAEEKSINRDVARRIFRDLGVGFSENAIVSAGHDFASWEAGFNAAAETAEHRLGLTAKEAIPSRPPSQGGPLNSTRAIDDAHRQR